MRSPALTIPESTQVKIRERLRIARESRGIPKNNCAWAGPGTINNWERYDCSSIRLRDLYSMGEALGWTIAETMAFIFGDQEVPTISYDRNWRRMSIYLRSLPNTLAETACDIVEKLVEYNSSQGGATPRKLHLGGPIRRDGRGGSNSRHSDKSVG